MRQILVVALAMILVTCTTGGSPSSAKKSEPSPGGVPTASMLVKLQPDVFVLSAKKARLVSVVLSLFDAYNRGSLEDALAVLDARISWSDCNYKLTAIVDLKGKSEVAKYLQQRFADHDQFEIASIENFNPEPESSSRALGISYLRRSSDTLRSLGFRSGIKPAAATKVVFADPADQILAFGNGPVGASAELCRPTKAA